MERKLIVFMNESRIHKEILDQLLAYYKMNAQYRNLDDKIIKSHCETKKALDNAINNDIENATIYTYDTSSLSFDLTRYGFDLYVCAWVSEINKKVYYKYLKTYNKTKKIPKFIRNILGIECSNVVKMAITEELKTLKIYEHMPEISKDLRYGHNLSKLLLGGLFNGAIMNSDNQDLATIFEDDIIVYPKDDIIVYPTRFVSKVVLTERPYKNYMNFIKLV